jgi:hypothetical protein
MAARGRRPPRGFRAGDRWAPHRNPESNGRLQLTIVGILVVIILILLAVYLFQRVR